jgi:pSer/pThr/pTyr-binding forkhead associated (FHA) protein
VPSEYQLRLGAHVIDLHEGETVLGREESCGICLDDEQVSRRHAMIRVTDDGVVLVDLESRNGTLLNGKDVTVPSPLTDGDVITIGRQELTLKALPKRTQLGRRRRRGTLEGVDGRRIYPTVTRMAAPDAGGAHGEVTAEADLLRKALQMGRWEEAERLLKARVARMLKSATTEAYTPEDPRARLTVDGLLRLAQHTMDPVWIDRLFKLHTVLGWWMSANVAQRASRLLRAIGSTSGSGLRDYIATWKKRQNELSLEQQRALGRWIDLQKIITD